MHTTTGALAPEVWAMLTDAVACAAGAVCVGLDSHVRLHGYNITRKRPPVNPKLIHRLFTAAAGTRLH